LGANLIIFISELLLAVVSNCSEITIDCGKCKQDTDFDVSYVRTDSVRVSVPTQTGSVCFRLTSSLTAKVVASYAVKFLSSRVQDAHLSDVFATLCDLKPALRAKPLDGRQP